jgi:hypothetical protein
LPARCDHARSCASLAAISRLLAQNTVHMRFLSNLEDSVRAHSRRLRGLPRQSVQIALPKLQLGDCSVVPDLLHASSVVYSVAAKPASLFDQALQARFGCRVHSFEPLASVPVLDCVHWTMRNFGHRHVDLLHLDIEGGEYATIEALATTQLRPCQLVVDFHHHMPNLKLEHTERALAQLNDLGYRIFDCQASGYEYSLAIV